MYGSKLILFVVFSTLCEKGKFWDNTVTNLTPTKEIESYENKNILTHRHKVCRALAKRPFVEGETNFLSKV